MISVSERLSRRCWENTCYKSSVLESSDYRNVEKD